MKTLVYILIFDNLEINKNFIYTFFLNKNITNINIYLK